jgi:uncharacterized membrane protein YqhA
MNALETIFERVLWASRFLTLIAVIASSFGAIGLLYVASVDAFGTFSAIVRYGDRTLDAATHAALRLEIVTGVAEFVDGFLFALVLLIFSFGIYELFISKIDAAERSPVAKRILLIDSLDDLKERLVKVIFVILIVRYFEFAVHQHVATALDLLFLAFGIFAIAIALYLTKPKDGSPLERNTS